MPYGNIIYLVLQIFNSIFAVIVVFNQRRNPAVSWAWLVVIALIPVAGFVIYMIVGQDSKKHRVFADKSRDDEQLLDEYTQQIACTFTHASTRASTYASTHASTHASTSAATRASTSAATHASPSARPHASRGVCPETDAPPTLPDAPHLNDLVCLNHYAGGGVFTDDNQVTLFHEGRAKFDALLADIARARSFIFVQYYILRDDETGRHILRQLTQKAAEGVEVCLLVDGMGCFFTPRSAYKPLVAAGGQVGVFMPPALVRLNYRNHRKLAIIDGTVGYVGGLNIGNEYMGMTKRFGYWRDTHLRVQGGAVRPLTLRFMMDWYFTAAHEYGGSKPRLFRNAPIPLCPRYFPTATADPAHTDSGVRMQIVSSGPDTRYPSILHGYCKMITEADRSIRIQTPYFVPDESLFGALRVAALSGIDVQIMIPANPDHPFVYWAALSYLGELIECGVKCYAYEKGFIHSKVLVIDSLVSSVGTANMDVRSFKLNFECNAFIYDQSIACELEAAFENDRQYCHSIRQEDYIRRAKTVKIKESLSRLLSPLL